MPKLELHVQCASVMLGRLMAIHLTTWISLSNWQEPSKWAQQWFDSAQLLRETKSEWPLDWMIHLGGPVRQRGESLLREWTLVRTQEAALSGGMGSDRGSVNRPFRELLAITSMPPDPVIEYERQAWIHEFREANPDVSVKSVHRNDFVSDTVDWENEFLGERHRFSRFIAGFHASAKSHRFEPPWLYWARLPLWLKKQASDIQSDIDELDERMSVIRTLLSPQNEIEESFALEPGELKLNPTMDVVQSTKLFGICRQSAAGALRLQRREFDELDAMIVDEIRESFRIRELDLIRRLSVAGAAERITELYELGFILRSAQVASS